MSIVEKTSAVERLRRAVDWRFRDAEAAWVEGSADDCAELKLELLLLREENARLKADRHRPVDLGTVIEYLRLIAKQPVNPETVEDAWAMLGDSHVVREALAQATTEIEAAISALEARVREDPRPRGEVLPLSVALVNAQPGTGAPANTDGLVRTA